MPERENALWAKTRRRNMAANRRRTERSESAAERARKAPPNRPRRRTFTPRCRKGAQSAVFLTSRRAFTSRRRNCAQSKYVRIVGTKKEQQKRCPTAHIAFRARRTPCRAVFCSPLLRTGGRKKARPPGAPLRGGKSPAQRPGLRTAVRKNKRGKTPRPNSWTEASAPAPPTQKKGENPRFCY